MELVTTKHGFKARRITQAQEDALDNMAAHPSSYPRIQKVDVLNESFGNVVQATLNDRTQWEERKHIYLIAQDGSVARVV